MQAHFGQSTREGLQVGIFHGDTQLTVALDHAVTPVVRQFTLAHPGKRLALVVLEEAHPVVLGGDHNFPVRVAITPFPIEVERDQGWEFCGLCRLATWETLSQPVRTYTEGKYETQAFRAIGQLPPAAEAFASGLQKDLAPWIQNPLCQSWEQSLGGGLRGEYATALAHQPIALEADRRGVLVLAIPGEESPKIKVVDLKVGGRGDHG